MFGEITREPVKTSILRWIITLLLSVGGLVAPLLVAPIFRDTVNTPKIFWLLGITTVTVVVALVGLLITPFFHLRRTLFNGLLGILSLFLIISSFISLEPHLSFLGKGETFVLSAVALLAWIILFFFCIQTLRSARQWFTYYAAILIGTTIAVIMPVLISVLPISFGIFNQPLAHASSAVAITAAILAVLHCGPALMEGKLWRRWLHTVGAVLMGMVLLRLGFTLAWIILIVGLIALVIAQSSQLAHIARVRLILPFLLMVVAIVSLIIGSPVSLKAPLPTEVSLGASASWEIASGVLHHSLSRSIVGTGLGTFLYDFAEYRTPAFNLEPLVATVYFQNAYSTFLTLLLEIGWLGVLLFAAVIVVGIGYLLLVFRHAPWTERVSEGMERLLRMVKNFQKPVDAEHVAKKNNEADAKLLLPVAKQLRPELITVGVAWLLLTVSFLFSSAEAAQWWLWWGLLGMLVAGVEIARLSTHTKEIKIRLSFDTPHATLGFFVILVLIASSIGVGAYGVRVALADYDFNVANKTHSAERVNNLLQSQSWNANAEVALALSNEYVQNAAALTTSSSVQAEVLAESLAPAIAAAKQATELAPANFRTWENSGIIYLNAASVLQSATPWAIDSLTRALVLTPSSYSIAWQLGNAYALSHDTKKAEELYLEAIANKPDFVPAYVALSQMYEQAENMDKAIAVYEPIMPIVRTNPELLFRLGRLFYNRNQKQDYDRAEAVWLQAVSVLPDFSNALYSLGVLNEKKGNVAEALKYYRRVAELNPKNHDIQAKIHQLGG